MRNIAIFASGSGTNAENIIKYFSNKETGKVSLVLSNKHDAYVLKRAAMYGVQSFFFDRNDFYCSGKVLEYLQKYKTDFIILAGFLWLVPDSILDFYKQRVINIHPALLPLYGGRGMYGERVHKAVISNHDKESGITIHYVNSRYDAGDIIFQARCNVEESDTPDSLAGRVHELEYEYFPLVIEKLLKKIPEKS